MLAPKLPLPPPLTGSEPGSFANRTLSTRLPNLASRVLADTPWPPEIAARLQALIDQMPHGPLRPLQDPEAPDLADWERYLAPYLGQSWLEPPWFLAETYFFRCLLQATGYFQPGPGQGLDPYAPQKRQSLLPAEQALRPLASEIDVWFHLHSRRLSGASAPQPPDSLADLFHANVWGNQSDLSLWPASDGKQPVRPEVGELNAHLLVDDALAASQYLTGLAGRPVRIDFILDNVGPELAHDLLLADFLLRSELAQQVAFRLKPYPTYISDATLQDVQEMLTVLEASKDPSVRSLAQRLRAYQEAGRWRLVSDYYWVSPLSGWEMPADLRQELGQSDLILSKGDANYRRWVGDRAWPFTTPIDLVVSYLPTPYLALRVLKAELIAGLQPGQPERVAREDPQWLYDGQWGMIQFVK